MSSASRSSGIVAPEHLLAGVSTGWSKRYFCLRAPGELAYFKHEGDDEPVGVVDLRLVVGVGAAVDDASTLWQKNTL